jgi:hypothetical protein
MKSRERIIRYIDGQMNQEEKSLFEEELKKSSSLQGELEDCRKLLKEFREIKNISVDEKYFTNLLSEFRMKSSPGKKLKFYPAFGYSLIAALVIIFFSVIFLQDNGEIPQAEDVVSSLSDNEAEYILNNYSDQEIPSEIITNDSGSSDSILTQLIADELISGNPDLNYIMESSESNFYNTADEITETEANIVYSELINKKFF